MPNDKPTDDETVTLATRIPRSLMHALRIRRVEAEEATQDFVIAAVREALAGKGRRHGR